MSLIRNLFLGGRDVEHHGNCPACGDTIRAYAQNLTPGQQEKFFADARDAVRQHCEENDR